MRFGERQNLRIHYEGSSTTYSGKKVELDDTGVSRPGVSRGAGSNTEKAYRPARLLSNGRLMVDA
jgi:hypothetical protein